MSTSHESLDQHWKQRAQHEVLEDPTKVEDNIFALRTLVQGEKGLYSRTDDTFLLAFLRARKHNVNEAFRLLKNFYKVKKAYPKHLECCLPSEKGYVYDMDIMTVLDQKDNDGRIVVIMRFEKLDYKKIVVEECYQTIATVLSFCCEDPHVQISGAVFIVDMAGYGLQHFLVATPSNLSLFIKMFQDCFPLRLKGVHIVNAPSLFAAVFAISKPFLKEKMRQRIHVHGRNMSSLHEYVPYEILPKQLGGMVPNFNFNSFRHKLQQNEDMIKAWNKYGYGMKPQDNFEIGMSK
ncbi:clavesin-2-like isoform X1 [Schistocerca cancellata]|uniref:clavesin-2-like isoform X1 n=1 Tax=Schistocerca cancellata TaxID=274614 RepID=UPI002117E966|nr:clavesin-2-like isoform X1 [Schistocerca cancellata]XP_049774275.1 clavesin-2-like isoform X1 [Schistocerca cancellata]XP_049774276.1 clavesin-2-like isoform X1 [Schistocerca cancellata]XP_049774277.1 clavesin-2-like isoform X1 [Schistocerca cancellata]